MSQQAQEVCVTEPFPIFAVSNRYFLYDVDVVTYVRRKYHICGVLIGSLPQIPQQNVFLGIPLQLMSEEARLLVEKEAAYLVDDVKLHKTGSEYLSEAETVALRKDLETWGRQASENAQQGAKERQEKAFRKLQAQGKLGGRTIRNVSEEAGSPSEHEDSLFSHDVKSTPTAIEDTEIWAVTPTTSRLPSDMPAYHAEMKIPRSTSSYPLFAHLHAQNYFLSPGLRFGCQYLVYPGDPLRFHSHFLAVGAEWEEELDLIDLIAGGRLGTGVKKGFLIGGVQKADVVDQKVDSVTQGDQVRTFCIEWGGM